MANVETPDLIKTVEYNKVAPTLASSADYFLNNGNEACAVNSCTLKNAGCTDPYDGTILSIKDMSIMG